MYLFFNTALPAPPPHFFLSFMLGGAAAPQHPYFPR